MAMKPLALAGCIVLGAAVILGTMSAFTVQETQRAVVLQFGKPVHVIPKAGLYFKVPLIQEVRYLDKRTLSVDPGIDTMNLSVDKGDTAQAQPSDMTPEMKAELEKLATSSGGMQIKVEVFARYQIIDPLLFIQRMGSEEIANQRILSVMNGATRDVLGATTLRALLSPKRNDVMQDIKNRVNAQMKDRGIEIVDIRIVRADLTDSLRNSTVKRMITENNERATKTRAVGQQAALQIRAEADKEKTVLLAEAQKQSQIERGAGDALAIKTYNEAYNKDKDFYGFTRTLEAYRNTLATPDTRMILSPEGAFLRYLDKP
ncbi:MAG: HflC protein [Micavibrio sp.]|nr:HflC protein [Micavibrio sp.]